MEAPPSPQSVGREFVRQYYTLLNKAPTHLHRFYNNYSSFVHGGLDPPNRETSPVIGQKQIHQKIQQLNFRDCHAKITQVDSQATLGSGVVVQVTGELSNAGQPMRRFTQTFVLAAQSPKKYYVHNDIFRYQDEIITDEECDADEVRSEEEEVVVTATAAPTADRPMEQQMGGAQPPGVVPPYYPAASAPALQPTIQTGHFPPPPHVLNAQQPTVNGALHPEEMVMNQSGLTQPPMSNLQQAMVPPPQMATEEMNKAAPAAAAVEESPMETSYEGEEQEGVGGVDQQMMQQQPASNEPKTYANLLKGGLAYSSPPQAAVPHPTQQLIRNTSPPSSGGFNNTQPGQRTNNNNMNNKNDNNRFNQPPQQPPQQQQRVGRQDSFRGSSIGGASTGPGRNSFNEDDDKRRSQNSYGNDVHQLFLGNLPHAATEEELREIFSEFGTIVDLRVHNKPPTKPGMVGGRTPPNYGFITYDSQQSMQNCLQAKPIYYPKDDKNGVVLNVEVKKVKDRPTYGSGRPTDNNRGSSGGPRGDQNPNQRRSMSGGTGLIRGNSNNGPAPNNRNPYNRSGGPTNRGGGGGGGLNTYNRR